MFKILIYSISILFTPGPVNVVAFNLGLSGKTLKSKGYLLGVSSGMFILLTIYGYASVSAIPISFLKYISLIGSMYIAYLGVKTILSSSIITETNITNPLTFKNGILTQLLNPKATLATLPIATISFPENHITGILILVGALLFGILDFVAASTYVLLGHFSYTLIKNKKLLMYMNIILGLILIYVACTIFYQHTYLVFKGVSTY